MKYSVALFRPSDDVTGSSIDGQLFAVVILDAPCLIHNNLLHVPFFCLNFIHLSSAIYQRNKVEVI